jgi:hypothetical protein
MATKIKKYEKILAEWMREFAQERTGVALEYQFIQDKETKNFQVVRSGWDNNRYLYLVLFHFQIKENGKIWVFANNTDIDLERVFQDLSIPKSEIVPAFQPVYMRAYAGFAEA